MFFIRRPGVIAKIELVQQPREHTTLRFEGAAAFHESSRHRQIKLRTTTSRPSIRVDTRTKPRHHICASRPSMPSMNQPGAVASSYERSHPGHSTSIRLRSLSTSCSPPRWTCARHQFIALDRQFLTVTTIRSHPPSGWQSHVPPAAAILAMTRSSRRPMGDKSAYSSCPAGNARHQRPRPCHAGYASIRSRERASQDREHSQLPRRILRSRASAVDWGERRS
jgi:hypothetical protein